MIGILNPIDDTLSNELSKFVEVESNLSKRPKLDGLFIDWIPPKKDVPREVLKHQIEIVSYYRGKCKLIIFDRFFGLSRMDINHFKNHSLLLEPAINNRKEFYFQPFWFDIPNDLSLNLFDNKQIDCAYIGNIRPRQEQFEKYYLPLNSMAKMELYLKANGITAEKCELYKSCGFNIVNEIDIKNIMTFVLLGSQFDCEKGILDPRLSYFLSNGIIPLLPVEHRFFHSIFDELVVKKPGDIYFATKNYKNIGYGCAMNILERIKKYMPEFSTKHVVNIILEEVGK